MNRLKLLSVTFLALLVASPRVSHSQTTVNSDPVGFVTLTAAAGTGTAKRNTYLSFPLYEPASITGKAVGQITSVTSNTIVDSNAGWAPGDLSKPATPFGVLLTSGSALGRVFLISSSANTAGAAAGSANTSTTVTIAPGEVSPFGSLPAAGVAVGDNYRIISIETLASAFPPSLNIRGGTSIASADSIQLINRDGSFINYFFNTGATPNRWSRQALGNPDASNTAILPYTGLVYQRLATNALSFMVTGTVPGTARKALIRNSGSTLLAQDWPVDCTLATLALQTTPNWRSSPSITNADNIQITSAAGTINFWYNGTNWLRQSLGNPTNNSYSIPAGTSILVRKFGSTSGSSTHSQNLPYNLNQ